MTNSAVNINHDRKNSLVNHEFDALLFLSFGGPDKPEDIRPFLENVTRGRAIPSERLAAVAEHYLHCGGKSPINDLNRDIIFRLDEALHHCGTPLPIYFGNRNWHPMIEDALAKMADDGITRALVFPTSAWGGYSGCRQYHEDIRRARLSVGSKAPELVKIRQYYDHPLLIASFADAVNRARSSLPQELREQARLVFTAHSVPTSADRTSGSPADGGYLYSTQVHESAKLVAGMAGATVFDVVWQSRSGSPRVPWLTPDICDHIDYLADSSVRAVIVCPIGFVSDHLEVLWDLDNEAAARAHSRSISFVRAQTPGSDPRFIHMILALINEVREGLPVQRLAHTPLSGSTTNGMLCFENCCSH
ncbi:MAG: ferrochelatase [Mycobacteriaceae bacterium]